MSTPEKDTTLEDEEVLVRLGSKFHVSPETKRRFDQVAKEKFGSKKEALRYAYELLVYTFDSPEEIRRRKIISRLCRIGEAQSREEYETSLIKLASLVLGQTEKGEKVVEALKLEAKSELNTTYTASRFARDSYKELSKIQDLRFSDSEFLAQAKDHLLAITNLLNCPEIAGIIDEAEIAAN